jgi:small subunit ribosomal protein S17e
MTTYKGKFDTDFEHNKKTLNEVAVVRSKGLKNEIAGYITSYLRRELEEQEAKEEIVAHDDPVDDTEEIEEQILN